MGRPAVINQDKIREVIKELEAERKKATLHRHPGAAWRRKLLDHRGRAHRMAPRAG